MKILAFDLETTGVKHWKNGIHQIAGIIIVDGEEKERFDLKVKPNPSAIIEDEALAVAGITRETLETYQDMGIVFKGFEEMLGKYVNKFDKKDKFHLLGYNNSAFDNSFLRAWFVQNAKTPKDAEFGNYFGSWFWSDTIDVMVLASNHLKDKRHEMENFKQGTVANFLGIEIDENRLHDALYDITVCLNIYGKVGC